MSCPTLQQIREAQSFHAGKVHEAVIRELDARVVERLEAQRQQIEHLHAVVETLRRYVMNG